MNAINNFFFKLNATTIFTINTTHFVSVSPFNWNYPQGKSFFNSLILISNAIQKNMEKGGITWVRTTFRWVYHEVRK